MTKDWKWWHWVLVVLGIVIFIILFVVSFGKIDLIDRSEEKRTTEEKKKEAQERKNQLTAELEKDKALKRSLDKKVATIFLFTRFVLLALWGGVIYGVYCLGLIHNLSDVLMYSEVTILILVTFNFLTFGSITSVESFITLIKNRILIRVYQNHMHLANVIKVKQQEIKVLEEITTSNKL